MLGEPSEDLAGLTDRWDELRDEGLQDGVQLDGVRLISHQP